MKKYLYFATAVLVAMGMTFSSCGKNDNTLTPDESATNSDKPSVTKELTPEESKEKLMSVAEKFIGKFNTDDQKAAIQLADGLYEKYESYSWDEFENHYEHRYDAIFNMPRYVKQVVAGQKSPTAIDESYIFSFEGESAIWEADDATRTWKYKGAASDNSVIFRFTDKNGTQCEAKAWGEGKTDTYHITEGTDVTAVLPAKILFTLKQGTNEIIRVEFGQEMVKNNHAYFTVSAAIVNLKWTTDIKINSTSGSFAFAFYYGSERMFSAAANLPSYQLIDKQDSQTYEEWLEQYGDRYDELLRNIGEADALIDIIGEVQIKVKVNNFSYAYRDYNNWRDRYSSYTKEGSDKFCDIINSNQTNGIYYNSDIKQAQVHAQTTINYTWQDSEGTHTEYAPEAVLLFPDGTTYAFEEYFNRKPFTDLQYSVEDLLNKYIRLSQLLYDNVGEVDF